MIFACRREGSHGGFNLLVSEWPRFFELVKDCDGVYDDKSFGCGLTKSIKRGNSDEDFVTGLPLTPEGHNAFITVVDRFTKMGIDSMR
jgi:hypothetical protein